MRQTCCGADACGSDKRSHGTRARLLATVWAATVLGVTSIGAIGACSSEAPRRHAADTDRYLISGSLVYRERIALRPGGSARIILSDVSIADGTAPALAEQTIDLEDRQVPVVFELPVARASLTPGGSYALRAMLLDADGHPVWTTDTVHLIDPTRVRHDLGILWLVRVGSPDPGTLASSRVRFRCGDLTIPIRHESEDLTITLSGRSHRLVRVRAASGARYEGSGSVFWEKGDRATLTADDKTYPECVRLDEGLTGAEWVVEDVADRGIVDYSRATLNFEPSGRVWGRASCNTYTGTYAVSGSAIEMSQLAVTRKACVEALMNQESTFLEILGDAHEFQIASDGALIITARSGERVGARLGERSPR